MATFDRSVFDEIEKNIVSLTIDEIRKRLEPLTKGISVETPIFNPGNFVYRGRKLGCGFDKGGGIKLADILYPPKERAKIGRLNRDGQPLFYCSMSKEPVFFELPDLKDGDEIILSFWKTKDRMLVNNIGYTEHVFKQLGAKREVPNWKNNASNSQGGKEEIALPELSKEAIDIAMSHDDSREVREAISKYFMRQVGPDNSDSYKLTVAIGETHLGNIVNSPIQFAGVLYPSVRNWGNGDNLALTSQFVDNHLEFRKALHIRIDRRTDPRMSIKKFDHAREFDADGNLIWLGRLPNWKLTRQGQMATMVLAPGRDEDGDYEISKEGSPAHWMCIDGDTGKTMPPS